MSQNLKDILKNGEEQFDSKAWESLSQRLDTVLPVKKTNPFFPKNIWIAGASVLFIGSGIFLFLNQSNEDKISKPEEKIEIQNQISDNKQTQESTTVTTNKIVDSKTETAKNVVSNNSYKQEIENKNSFEQVNTNLNQVYQPNPEKIVDKENIKETILTPFKLPKLQSSYCLNDEITISNSNKSKCFLLDENKIVLASINGKESAKITLKNTGSYYLQYPIYDANVAENSTDLVFSVADTKQAEFSIDNEVLFENSIPYITLTTNNFQNGMSWSTNKGEIKEQTDKTKLTVFKKGIYTVSLEKIDENKCKTIKTQQIEIKEEYNLLAPNAFIPTGSDIRNIKFMPYALTQRNVMFDLIIQDPSTGKIVFQSNSAENAWDGIDKNTGQMVKANKSFIWKVSLKNPEIGEKPEYTGTIVMIKN